MESLIFARRQAGRPLGESQRQRRPKMATAGWIIAGIFALGIVIAMLARFGWSIGTQHRDHDVVAEGPLHKRRVWSTRPPQTHAGPVNPDALPADPATGERVPEARPSGPAQ